LTLWDTIFMQTQMVIMLVDDEERFLSTTSKLLARLHYVVLTATSGARALELLENNEVHVVILDVKMPGMDGIDALKQIKRRFPLVEVIMLTGHATLESAVEGLQNGAFDYLMKPADIPDLIHKAGAAFQRRLDLEGKIRVARRIQVRRIPRVPTPIRLSAILQGMESIFYLPDLMVAHAFCPITAVTAPGESVDFALQPGAFQTHARPVIGLAPHPHIFQAGSRHKLPLHVGRAQVFTNLLHHFNISIAHAFDLRGWSRSDDFVVRNTFRRAHITEALDTIITDPGVNLLACHYGGGQEQTHQHNAPLSGLHPLLPLVCGFERIPTFGSQVIGGIVRAARLWSKRAEYQTVAADCPALHQNLPCETRKLRKGVFIQQNTYRQNSYNRPDVKTEGHNRTGQARDRRLRGSERGCRGVGAGWDGNQVPHEGYQIIDIEGFGHKRICVQQVRSSFITRVA
jgi:CheY-like chemotaxis protein